MRKRLTVKSTFGVEISIPAQRIVDLFTSACEGGSNYWCRKLKPKGKHKDAYEAMLGGFLLVDGESFDDTPIDVTVESIERALKLFPLKCPKQFGDFLAENDDSETGDCFLQLCTFGEVIYG